MRRLQSGLAAIAGSQTDEKQDRESEERIQAIIEAAKVWSSIAINRGSSAKSPIASPDSHAHV